MKPLECPPQRPILRYHGSKWRIAPWVIEFFPKHRVYVEPYGGGASVLIRKAPTTTEIYNEMDDELVNLFRVLRDPELAKQLHRAISLTPYARMEYNQAYEHADHPVEQARRTLIKTWMGTRSKGLMNKSGFDTRINRDGFCGRTHAFAKIPEIIDTLTQRFAGVVIENTDALKLIPRTDAEHTLFYIDPPYVPDTRSGKYYRHEMDEDDHRAMAKVLHACKGMIVLSGYANDLYDRELFVDWHREELPAFTDGAHARTEVVWLNDAAKRKLWDGQMAFEFAS